MNVVIWQSLHMLADFPQLCEFAKEHTAAKRLDGRACAHLYRSHYGEIAWDALSDAEAKLLAALDIHRKKEAP